MADGAAARLEELLAEALAAHDAGGAEALAAFLAANEAHRSGLERGLERCRQMGLLAGGPVRDFPERLGDFRLVRRLGSGGMGVVYEAVQESLGRRVALKVIRPELLYFDGARRRFAREIDAVSALDHPSIVPVLAAGEQDGLPWFAMALLGGATVDDVFARMEGRRPAELRGEDLRAAIQTHTGTTTGSGQGDVFTGSWWEAALRLFVQLGDGLAHAHAHGIVHRDIKPSNCMLLPDGRALVLDFGVARMRGAHELTRAGTEPGSPAFMSPEQLRGVATDERSDIYSLAITLWQLLACARPFPATDIEQHVLRGELPPLSRQRGVPRELAIVVHRAADLERDRRYASMAAFVEDLRAVLARRPITARRLPVGLRLRRFVERRRAFVAAAVVLACVGGAVPFVLAAQQQEVAEVRAESERALLATLDTMRDAEQRLGGAGLPDVAAVDPLVRAVYVDALPRYRELLRRHPEHARLRLQAAGALARLGEMEARSGDRAGGDVLLQEAIAVVGAVDETSPQALFERRGYAWLARAGLAVRQEDRALLEQAVAAAARDFAEVERRAPGSIASCRGRSEVAVVQARLHPGAEGAAAAEACLREGLTLALAWAAQDAADVEAQLTVVRRLSGLGAHLRKSGRFEDAAMYLQDAVDAARALPENERLWPPPRMLLAAALESHGNLLIDRRDAAAVAPMEECVQLREAVSARFADNVLFRVQLGAAWQNLARALLVAGDVERAEAFVGRAIAVQRGVLAGHADHADAARQLQQHLALLVRCQSQLRRREELVRSADELAKATANASSQHWAAWALLRAHELGREDDPAAADAFWRRQGERVMELLLAAERLGWDPTWRLDRPLHEPLRAFAAFEELRRRVGGR